MACAYNRIYPIAPMSVYPAAIALLPVTIIARSGVRSDILRDL